MATTGLEVFDKSLQTTHIWLDEIMQAVGPDRQCAYHTLRSVLHALRDRLTVDQAAHLSAQLPMVVRGIYYEGYHPARMPETWRTEEEFLARVGEEMRGARPVNTREAVRSVFGVLGRHLSPGQADKLFQALPDQIRRLRPPNGPEPAA
jgi:uncharacterized protein (DUF2267 family)